MTVRYCSVVPITVPPLKTCSFAGTIPSVDVDTFSSVVSLATPRSMVSTPPGCTLVPVVVPPDRMYSTCWLWIDRPVSEAPCEITPEPDPTTTTPVEIIDPAPAAVTPKPDASTTTPAGRVEPPPVGTIVPPARTMTAPPGAMLGL